MTQHRDIDLLEGHTKNWMNEVGELAGLEVVTPLWQMNRENILEEFFNAGFEGIFSCIKNGCGLSTEYVGTSFTLEKLRTAKEKEQEREKEEESETKGKEKKKFDLCGENGEYHTMTTNGPLFCGGSIKIDAFNTAKNENALVYMKDITATLADK